MTVWADLADDELRARLVHRGLPCGDVDYLVANRDDERRRPDHPASSSGTSPLRPAGTPRP